LRARAPALRQPCRGVQPPRRGGRSNRTAAPGRSCPAAETGLLEVAVHHVRDEILEGHLRLPAEHLAGLAGIAEQRIDLGRTEVAGVDLDQRLFAGGIDANLVTALAAPFDATADDGEGVLDELADG